MACTEGPPGGSRLLGSSWPALPGLPNCCGAVRREAGALTRYGWACLPARGLLDRQFAFLPATPLVVLVIFLAFSFGRRLRVALPACHISELPISASSLASRFW